MEFIYEVEGGNFTKAGNASSAVKKTLKQLNVNPKVVKRTVVALYEAEVNIVAHAYKGVIKVNITSEHISIVLDDNGPGIPDIELAMQEGYSTASSKVREMGFGAGMGLPNIKKNVDELNVTSEVEKGTKVEIKTYL
ncbi:MULTISPECIES: ATP-binding protein [unclassified Saccharicrinis]|uniref:ATP-binding protein n=1 Tax=unclassified Saccharicrinis TaxID=2646859 RepID=UPI003D350534